MSAPHGNIRPVVYNALFICYELACLWYFGGKFDGTALEWCGLILHLVSLCLFVLFLLRCLRKRVEEREVHAAHELLRRGYFNA